MYLHFLELFHFTSEICPYTSQMKVAVGFVKECGAMLQVLSPQGLHGKRFESTFYDKCILSVKYISL
jgi:hypothetical protein